MNKAELIDDLQRHLGDDCTRSFAERALGTLLEGITRGLRKDGQVQITGFGTFEVKHRAARTVRNPKTGEPLQVAASKSVGFRPGAALKASVADVE